MSDAPSPTSPSAAQKGTQDPYARAVTAEAVTFIYRNLLGSIAFLSPMPFLMVWVMWPRVDHAALIAWCAADVAVSILNVVLAFSHRRCRPSIDEAPRWGRYYTWSSFITGVVWGCACMFFFVPDSAALQVFLYVYTIGQCTGSIILQPFWIESAYVLIATTLSLAALRLFMEDSVAYHGLAVFLLLGMGALLAIGHYAGKTARASIRLRFENLDLVERLRLENERAEMANRAKTRFLASASHDLRQPVHALTLFVSALKSETVSERARALHANVSASVDALTQLLNALLDISKLDANIVETNLEPCTLDEMLGLLHNEYAPQAQDRHLVFRLDAEPGLVVRSDRALLETMLRNLLSNALRYTQHGSVTLQASTEGARVCICVRDTGPGIPLEQQQAIFQEFVQLDNPERDRQKGLGLGLAIVHRLAGLLDHELGLQSAPGEGSVFSIRVGVDELSGVPAVGDMPGLDIDTELSGLCVLVIDDERDVRIGMREVLEQWGVRALLAASEDEALQLVTQTGTPDVIIADFRLREGRTGAQAIAALRAMCGQEVAAMIVTGDTDPQRLREARDSGNTLMHKPVQPAKLRAYLRGLRRARA